MSYKYPLLDPFKVFIPIRSMTWPGSPDLQFDYYSGRAINGPIWLREVAVSYHFYKVTGRTVHDERVARR